MKLHAHKKPSSKEEAIREYEHEWFFWIGALVSGSAVAILSIQFWVIFLVTIISLAVATLKFYSRTSSNGEENDVPTDN